MSSFGVIQNNTALKPAIDMTKMGDCFGVIQNNTALKL